MVFLVRVRVDRLRRGRGVPCYLAEGWEREVMIIWIMMVMLVSMITMISIRRQTLPTLSLLSNLQGGERWAQRPTCAAWWARGRPLCLRSLPPWFQAQRSWPGPTAQGAATSAPLESCGIIVPRPVFTALGPAPLRSGPERPQKGATVERRREQTASEDSEEADPEKASPLAGGYDGIDQRPGPYPPGVRLPPRGLLGSGGLAGWRPRRGGGCPATARAR